jgi:hypothetical protein
LNDRRESRGTSPSRGAGTSLCRLTVLAFLAGLLLTALLLAPPLFFGLLLATLTGLLAAFLPAPFFILLLLLTFAFLFGLLAALLTGLLITHGPSSS